MNDFDILVNIDDDLFTLLQAQEINSEEIMLLVDKREKLLNVVLNQVKNNVTLRETKDWKALVSRTEHIITIMQAETVELEQELYKCRHGNKSVLQYKKFS